MSVQTKLTDKTIRRRKNERANKRLRNKQAAISGRKPLRDPEYKAWIRTLPCVVCALWEIPYHQDQMEAIREFPNWKAYYQTSDTEAAHSGPHGISQKAPDSSCLPLCAEHHRTEVDSYHSLGPKFFAHHGLKEREILVAGYNLAFKERE